MRGIWQTMNTICEAEPLYKRGLAMIEKGWGRNIWMWPQASTTPERPEEMGLSGYDYAVTTVVALVEHVDLASGRVAKDEEIVIDQF